jgi:hypothetical protein
MQKGDECQNFNSCCLQNIYIYILQKQHELENDKQTT